jgi:hypothetical protein
MVETPGCQEVEATMVESTTLNQVSTGYTVSYAPVGLL